MTVTGAKSGSCAVELIRKRGGTGGISKIEADAELKAFVLTHIYDLTYKQIVDKIATEFPPDRRTSVSALSRWWQARLLQERQQL